jgi:hypothetical protein
MEDGSSSPERERTTVPRSAADVRHSDGRRRLGNRTGDSSGRRRGDHSGRSSGGRQRGDHPDPGSSSTSRSRDGHEGGLYNPRGSDKETLSPSDLNEAENEGLYNNDEKLSRRARLKQFYKKYRKQAKIGAGVAGLGVSGAVLFFSVAQGPFQFIHFAQLLQEFHMTSNEDFSDSRTERILIYALAGKGGERGRLSIKANKAADIWEKQVEKTMGIRPVYTSITRKNIGWEIVDKDKFLTQMVNVSANDTKNTAAIERVAGKGAEIRTVGEASAGGQGISPGGDKPQLSNDKLVLDTRNVPEKEKRILTRAISREVHTSKVISYIGARLLIKRGGVTYHPLEDRLPKPGEKIADWYSRMRQDAAKEDREGTKDTTLGKNGEKDADGKPETTPEIDNATDETNKTVEAAKASPGGDTIKGLVKGLGKGAAAVGILCAAKGIGNNVEDYKYANDALPMMRMGMRVISTGNQVMSGDDLNVKELGAFNDALYDPETKTSWTSAKSIQAELGQKQTGPDTPPEARLKNVNDKPVFFDALDSVPGLGTVCGVSSAIGNLPIIKQVSDAASSAVIASLNVVANTFGTSVEGIMQGALAAISGQSVNTEAKGADLGNLANTGAFLSANDTAITNGGVPLDQSAVLALKQEMNADVKHDNSTKSFAGRYLDPYDRNTLVAAAIDRLPASKAQLASMFTSPFTSLFSNFSSAFSPLIPSTYAASGDYDYGVPKFGFSPADRDNPKFDDPFENAAIVEKPGVLDELNEKYGKPCFGMTVTAGDDGTTIESESMGDDDLNVFKVMKKPECSPPHTVSSVPSSPLVSWLLPKASAATIAGNTDPMFLRYRFYLADAMNTNSLACFYGDEASCAAAGFAAPTAAAAEDDGTTETAGETVDMAKIFESSVSVACASGTKDIGVQDGYHDGKKVKIRTCAVSNFPSTSSESSNGLLVVNSRVSGVIYAMSAAAKEDGVDFSAASGFRSMKLQECLAAGGCGAAGPAATPGYSNHQMGLAIDFNNVPSTAAPGSGPTWNWLAKNASKFGYKNFPDEAWHWSPTGD